ncbi:hypothetical protein COCC4DRAFT_73492 [Bipolaris maydis ATCC 48331]|uniref:J domain-containing protein n=2 Tax=Cochliobolus heterostrophus TaxID=5016 RepID=M2SQW3_COCH5|nr:uncharacterized protein COCC4DRAFT_73492 [Bipolaris maydis ATCC 48331]EMD87710.1 hypothetical protein COCHEDRAFT_1196869 [Bipolaris maydis C5]KAJ5024018.1 hypothetical protein J3E73DRAFT_7427 [Bipolaris maydis]ENI03223.1 hypothetical protein COCC4DRAFT_73492 [Bipolaris maydis ATCC 48331]KAJ6206706.1 hypothetical protein PSV09DRAFT_1196869 [Bipolaris maydis]KAJ6268761.1 hypothetical protein PSV08DRAFT_321381 [Bipolaris maydis]
MSDNRELQDLAKSTTDDFYDLLNVAFDADADAIQKAYRKASIRYHPDKNPDDKNAADRFILLGWARDILIDENLKGEYDRARARRREKVLQDEMLDGRRRKLKEDLERREKEYQDQKSGIKRKVPEHMTETERKLHEIHKGDRKRYHEINERLAKEDQEEREAYLEAMRKRSEPQGTQQSESSEMIRAVKFEFPREGDGEHWDKDTLATMFSKYGEVDMVVLLKDKKIRHAGEKHRIASGMIVFTRVDHAHAAVMNAKSDYPALSSVNRATGEPDSINVSAKDPLDESERQEVLANMKSDELNRTWTGEWVAAGTWQGKPIMIPKPSSFPKRQNQKLHADRMEVN